MKRSEHNKARGAVLWFTGLSGSGKSTLASDIARRLVELGLPVEHLDGDQLRAMFPGTGFSREERDSHARRVGFLSSLLEKYGVFVVTSLISPYSESRRAVRDMCTGFIEIHVSTPLDVCEKRDPKGLYRRARNGEITQFTGVTDPYEAPTDPELTIDTSSMSAERAGDMVLAYLAEKGFVPNGR